MTVINTNMNSLNAQYALTVNARAQSKAMLQLSSGSRINSAADDSAGLAMSETMTAQIRGLNMAVKNANDGTRILEQILPFFTPDWTATLNLDSTMNHKYDIPIILNNIKSEDTYEGNFVERRVLTWTLDFTLKGYIFGPTRKAEQVKTSIINLYNIENSKTFSAAMGNTNYQDVITTTPVVTGKTIDEIEADDDYTFNQTIEQFYEQ